MKYHFLAQAMPRVSVQLRLDDQLGVLDNLIGAVEPAAAGDQSASYAGNHDVSTAAVAPSRTVAWRRHRRQRPQGARLEITGGLPGAARDPGARARFMITRRAAMRTAESCRSAES